MVKACTSTFCCGEVYHLHGAPACRWSSSCKVQVNEPLAYSVLSCGTSTQTEGLFFKLSWFVLYLALQKSHI